MNPKQRPDAATPIRIQPNGRIAVIKVLIVIAIIGLLLALLLPAVRSAGPAARRTQCKIHLKQIALALSNYESMYHALPPAYTVDENGKPMHSWRTLILQFLDEKALYDRIDLTKAWDDPANAEVAKTGISAYRCPEAIGPENLTTYVAIVTPNSSFRMTESRLLSEITDNHAETLMVLELDLEHAVPWMAPRDADEALFLAIGPKSKLGHSGGMQAAFVDATVRFLPADTEPQLRRALISIAGNEQLGP